MDKIGSEAFVDAVGLESVSIPPAVTEIGERAFMNCKGIRTVYFTNSISELKNDTFGNCTSLETIIVCCDKEEFKKIKLSPYYASGAASFEIKRHDATLNQINQQMHAMHCSVCGNAEDLEAHYSDNWKYVNDDIHKGVCKCGLTLERKHEWVESEWTISATKKKQGMKKFTCDICDSERTEIIPRLRGCESNVVFAPQAVVMLIALALVFRKKNRSAE